MKRFDARVASGATAATIRGADHSPRTAAQNGVPGPPIAGTPWPICPKACPYRAPASIVIT